MKATIRIENNTLGKLRLVVVPGILRGKVQAI